MTISNTDKADVKKQIEKYLFDLKMEGYDRRKIEEILNYKTFYVDQILSKGGNQRFLTAIKNLHTSVLEKTNEDSTIYTTPIQNLHADILETKSLCKILLIALSDIRAHQLDKSSHTVLAEYEALLNSMLETTKKEQQAQLQS